MRSRKVHVYRDIDFDSFTPKRVHPIFPTFTSAVIAANGIFKMPCIFVGHKLFFRWDNQTEKLHCVFKMFDDKLAKLAVGFLIKVEELNTVISNFFDQFGHDLRGDAFLKLRI